MCLDEINQVRRWTPGTFGEHHDAMARLEQDEAAYRAGYAAGLAGDGRPCPYPEGSLEGWSWSSGVIAGQAKRERGFRPPRLVGSSPD